MKTAIYSHRAFQGNGRITAILSAVLAAVLAATLACGAHGFSTTEKGQVMPHEKEWVILLHGMARTASSMDKLDAYLSVRGYRTVNLSYPSTREPIDALAEAYLGPAVARCREARAERVHFVTHSLGGIVVRQYLQSHSLPGGSRLVMLAPPNQGSEIVDRLKDLFPFKFMHGPAGQELGTGPDSTPNRLQPVAFEVGIIAGDRSYNPLFSALIPGPDDGKVSIERAKLREMKDFIVVPSSHTFIMKNTEALKQVAYFLDHGKFDHEP